MKIRRLVRMYFLVTGIVINLIGIVVLIYGIQHALALGLPLPILVNKVLLKIEDKLPEYSWILTDKLGIRHRAHENTLIRLPDIAPGRFTHDNLARQIIAYDETGKPQSSSSRPPTTDRTTKRSVSTATTVQLLAAIRTARAGDVISIEPGEYSITQHSVPITVAGKPDAPIIVTGQDRHAVRVRLDTIDGFHVKAPFWRFENMSIEGVCADHDNCEHAFHVVGNGHSVVIRNNSLTNFNAAIKVNGTTEQDGTRFPDAGLIQNNAIFNTSVRQTGYSVTPIDIVGANDWVVRGNLIADFVKGRGDQISYAAFMKGNSERGVFERNLVICEMKLLGDGTRIGLSFGGGGTAERYCRDGSCSTEHSQGTIRNNIIMRCPREVGIYLNRAAASEIHNNTMHQTLGIDVRFPTSTATIANNILTGRILERDHGYSTLMHNLIGSMSPWFWEASPRDWFINPDEGDFKLRSSEQVSGRGLGVVSGIVDFCGRNRSRSGTDLGAIEYSTNVSCEPLKLFVD